MRKKKKKKKKPKTIYVSNKSLKLTNWMPPVDKYFEDIETNSWFDIKIHEKPDFTNPGYYDALAPVIPPESFKQQLKTIKMKKYNKVPVFISTKKIRIYPTIDQKFILDSWFNCFAKMFNCTIHYLRNNVPKNDKLKSTDKKLKKESIKKFRKIASFYNCRKKLSSERNDIQESSHPHIIPIHIVNEAIQLAVSNYKSCLTNFLQGHISKFRIREWSKNKRRMILKIEKGFFKENTFCQSVFDRFFSSAPLSSINSTATLQYDKNTKKYILLVPVGKEEKSETVKKPKIDCGIDLGVRTFAAIYSKNNTYSICNSGIDKNGKYKNNFEKYHKKIDKINSLLKLKNKKQKVKSKVKENGKIKEVLKYKTIDRSSLLRSLRKVHNKIKNRVKDMHFKAAHEIVKSFDNIYIGKLNTKKILSKNNVTITRRTKRMVGVLSPYLFRQRLIHMGHKYGSNVVEVSEYLTTKTCSNCGMINYIGKSKIHKCRCGMTADRDENSAKNHLKLGLAQKK